jgi:drug/metabolite transporter (DMT)-like permease
MTNISRASLLGYGTIFLSAVLFGTYGIWSKLMGVTFEPFYQAWMRSLIIILLLLPLLWANKSFRRLERKDWPHLGIYIAFCVFTQAPLYYAFNNAPIGTVQLIFYAMFVITAYVVGRIYLGERITKIKLISVVLALVGLAVVFGVSVIAFAPLGLALAALNGIASGGEVASSKKISNKYSPILLVFWGWVCTFITHLPLSVLLGETQHVPQFNEAWLWLLVYALVSAVAFWLVIIGFRYVDAGIGSLIGLMEVVFAVVFGALVFQEALTWSVLIGGSMIIIAAMLPDLLNILAHRRVIKAVEPVREL